MPSLPPSWGERNHLVLCKFCLRITVLLAHDRVRCKCDPVDIYKILVIKYQAMLFTLRGLVFTITDQIATIAILLLIRSPKYGHSIESSMKLKL